ncbi:uncharacterized protein BO95DRAFT_428324 [Aspergillus brunneoviolaceus CBS 621.78]|uniref:Uncharacterized protein n=1 Tax=Aspergillus brunneoviolaceus CBS 621.78 TaxID=1450534 RepID=A0ACD1GJX2_9EURO|nr:hypothetical protein BO95DRAFT_428324 [Aspergillus brunneoviolaceus CBS 621.78]RAH49535.1 hypothetical protein BO95DRAFT_428324 [Aspergillus brunneoviolaceus CBS 621.78]
MVSRPPRVPPGYIAIYRAEKVILLMVLHLNSSVACDPERPFDSAEAQRVVERGFIDTFCGRVIRSNISGDFASPRSYDEVVGREGAFETCVELTKELMCTVHHDPSVLQGNGESLRDRLLQGWGFCVDAKKG